MMGYMKLPKNVRIFQNRRAVLILLCVCYFSTALLIGRSLTASAQVNPQSGSIGLQGTISTPPPKTGATITTPANGQNFTQVPITVAGICPTGLLVKLFSNNVFVGSTQCANGSFSLQIDLFSGTNDLIARVYDKLDQAGPDSNTITVTYNNTQFINLGPLVTITSDFAKRGANPGQQLTWPIVINGGTAPYALSVNWGDGSSPSLQSVTISGPLTLTHTYQNSGSYTITIQVSDKNGEIGFLQVVGIANGPASQTNAGTSTTPNGSTKVVTQFIWWPSLLALPLIVAAFWLGRRYELLSLRQQLEHSANVLQ